MKLWLKTCPRCSGDLALKRDISGAYIECLQCGLELNPRQTKALVRYGYVLVYKPEPAPKVAIEGRRHSA